MVRGAVPHGQLLPLNGIHCADAVFVAASRARQPQNEAEPNDERTMSFFLLEVRAESRRIGCDLETGPAASTDGRPDTRRSGRGFRRITILGQDRLLLPIHRCAKTVIVIGGMCGVGLLRSVSRREM